MAQDKKERLIFIDILRGLAVIWMIQTHTLSLMANEFKTGLFYSLLNISNGFVAVTFLFCAGAGFWLAAEKKVSSYKRFEKPLWLYLKRLGFILMLAYFLHSPIFSLSKLSTLTDKQIMTFFQIDVLQTIVYSSLLALLLLLLTPKNIYIKYISLILTAVFFIVAQFTWYSNPFEYLPFPFAFFLAAPPISKFPLFPWAGYFFAGVGFTAFFMDSSNRERLARIFLALSIIVPTLIFTLKYFGFEYLQGSQFWITNPFHATFRTFGSIFGFTLLFLTEKYYKSNKHVNLLLIPGRESLFLYISHLLIVYGSVMNVGIKYFGLMNLTPLGTFLMITAIISLCVSCSIGWHYLKMNYPRQATNSIYAILFFMFVFFILN
ncbi:MAG TPA: heparan-alpha-glucosaminide N-acetyltransferase domain-containing protein [Candidatus Kapabacteria bacterium]|nr:heparan-alpha-glucosaminide N-acetyltransferase domain-containing protein [Candidatus Kapabacteria bacterium]